MQNKTVEIITSSKFQNIFKFLGILFIILTFFISVSPESFIGFGYIGIFIFNVVSSSFLIMPILIEKFNFFLLIFFSALGNIPNTAINYFVGASSNTLFSNNKFILKIKKFMKRYGLFGVFILSLIPFPLDINGLMSGYLGIPFKKYIVVSFMGKLLIFALVGLGIVSINEALND